MTGKLTDEEIATMKGLDKPFGAGDIPDHMKASLQAKGMIASKGPGVLTVTKAGRKALLNK